MEDKPGALEIKTFADHHVITQPNPLQKVLRRVAEKDLDDPVAHAEKALAGLSGEFKNWMAIEADRLSAAHAAILKNGFTNLTREELFRAAHDIRVTPPLSDTPLPGLPPRACAGSSSTRPISTRCRPS
jgi:hypothetical protein